MPARDNDSAPAAEREVVISRVFDAPTRLLFAAHTTPAHLMRWFGPPGWTLTRCEVDFRIGGQLRLAMTGHDDVEGPTFSGTYLEIVPDQKIVYTGAFDTPGAEAMTTTITFAEQGNQTTLTIRTLFASVAMKNEHLGQGYARSWTSILDQLAHHIVEIRAG